MEEHRILTALVNDRKAYEQVKDWLEADDFTAQGQMVLEHITRYYDKDRHARRVDKDILLTRIKRALPSEKAGEPFEAIVGRMDGSSGARNVAEELLVLKRDAAGARLAGRLGARANATREDIEESLDEYRALHEATCLEDSRELVLYQPSVTELFTETLADANRIKVAPPELNRRIGGGVLPGHCIVLFGRVEMGKSLFALNAAAGFVGQGLRTLFIENEDNVEDTRRRFTQRLIRRPLTWIKDNAAQADKMAVEKGIEHFLLTDTPETPRQVEAAILQQEPQVCIINQMRNMAKGNDVVTQLDQIAHELRRIGKKHKVVMVLITAAREGETDSYGDVRDKPELQLADVYSSRTGIPAVADLLMGWGGSAQLKNSCMACISLCKNKIVDAGGHGSFYVKIDPETGVIFNPEEHS